MAPPKRPWFRHYVELFTDIDFRAMPYAHRLTWEAVMGLARMSRAPGALLDKAGGPIPDEVIADFAAVKVAEARAAMRRFVALGWVRVDDGVRVLPNWDKRQFESDDVTSRVAKHRASNGDVTANDPPDVTALPHGTEVQSSEDLSTSSREPTLVGPSSALSLIDPRRRETHRAEVDMVVMALVDAYGPEPVDRAVQQLVDDRRCYPWPSNAEKALRAILDAGKPVEPHPLDETQKAARALAEEGNRVTDELAQIEPDRALNVSEVRKARDAIRYGAPKDEEVAEIA